MTFSNNESKTSLSGEIQRPRTLIDNYIKLIRYIRADLGLEPNPPDKTFQYE